MTTVMTAIDTSSACATGRDQPAGGTTDDAIAQFGAMVDEALGSLENRGPDTDEDADEDADTKESDATGTANTGADAALLALTAMPAAPSPTTIGADAAGSGAAAIDAAATAGVSAVGEAATTTAETAATTVDASTAPVAEGDGDPQQSAGEAQPSTGTASQVDGASSPAEQALAGSFPLTVSITDDAVPNEMGTTGMASTVDERIDEAAGTPDDAATATFARTGNTTAPPTDPAVDSVKPHQPDAVGEAGEPWQQLAHAVRSVRHDKDGTHTMTIRLDPPELGTVELEVQVRDGRLHVHAATDSPIARDVLARSMPELRAALDAGGITAGSLDVGARTSGQGLTGHSQSFGNATGGDGRSSGRDGHALGRTGTANGPMAGDEPTANASTTTRLDLRL